MSDVRIHLNVNGEDYHLAVPPQRMLVDVLRDDLQLTGTKRSCDIGVCGACTVLLDGRTVSSCLLLAARADGARLTTIEGLATEGHLHPVQAAFLDCWGFQCGFCTPGMVLTTVELLDRDPEPSRESIVDALMGNLCRCTGYRKIIEAIEKAADSYRSPRRTP
jgi:carbon-monoxide dehydrogenase small subunit